MARDAGPDLRVRGLAGRAPCIHHEIHGRQLLLAMSERFAHETLEAVTVDGIAGGLHADREPEACMANDVRPRDHHKQRVGGALALPVNSVKLRLVGEAALAGEAARGERDGGASSARSDGEALAAFGTTTAQDLAAVGGGLE